MDPTVLGIWDNYRVKRQMLHSRLVFLAFHRIFALTPSTVQSLRSTSCQRTRSCGLGAVHSNQTVNRCYVFSRHANASNQISIVQLKMCFLSVIKPAMGRFE